MPNFNPIGGLYDDEANGLLFASTLISVLAERESGESNESLGRVAEEDDLSGSGGASSFLSMRASAGFIQGFALRKARGSLLVKAATDAVRSGHTYKIAINENEGQQHPLVKKRDTMSSAFEADKELLLSGTPSDELEHMPLWTKGTTPGDQEAASLSRWRELWNKNKSVWRFWERLYGDVVKGRVDFDLVRDIASQLSKADWYAGAAHVSKRVQEIEAQKKILKMTS